MIVISKILNTDWHFAILKRKYVISNIVVKEYVCREFKNIIFKDFVLNLKKKYNINYYERF